MSRREQNARTVQLLEEYCARLSPGDRLPTHTELMRQLGTSERMTLSAINTLKKQGRLTRRYGSGTFVAQLPAVEIPSKITITDSNTIALFTFRDFSFSTYGSELLLRIAETKELSVALRTVPIDGIQDHIPSSMPPDLLGCIVLGSLLLPVAKRLQDAGLRVVALADPNSNTATLVNPSDSTFQSISCVHSDNTYGGYLAAKHLIDLGHRRICFGIADPAYEKTARWMGHTEAIAEARKSGITIQDTALINSEYEHWIDNPQSAVDYFNSPDHATAFCAWNDRSAVMMMNFFMKIGLKIPDDISIVGHDNLPTFELLPIPLTTVDPHLENQVRFALRRLINSSNGLDTENAVVIPTFVPRASTGPYQQGSL